MTRTIHLRSYDLYEEILAYTLPQHTHRILTRKAFEQLDQPLTTGYFTREGARIVGLFAAPEGLHLIIGAACFLATPGTVTATSAAIPHTTTREFTLNRLCPDGQTLHWNLTYQERHGIGTNPYDNEVEDVDLFALLAAKLQQTGFYVAYTRDWPG